jgi:hypothetical protein
VGVVQLIAKIREPVSFSITVPSPGRGTAIEEDEEG